MARQSFLILAKEVAADNRISALAKLLLAQLSDHRNKTSGQCNPRHSKLAEELGTSVSKVQRGIAELVQVGFVQAKRGQYGCQYEIQICTRADPKMHPCRSGSSTPLYEPYLLKGHPPNKKPIERERRGAAAVALEHYYAMFGKKAAQ